MPVLTCVTGFNGHSDNGGSVKVQITEGGTHQRAGYCRGLQNVVL